MLTFNRRSVPLSVKHVFFGTVIGTSLLCIVYLVHSNTFKLSDVDTEMRNIMGSLNIYNNELVRENRSRSNENIVFKDHWGNFTKTSDNKSRTSPLCSEELPKRMGRLKVIREVPSLNNQALDHPQIQIGGLFRPKNCTARQKVALIVPYRDREQHVSAFIYNMHRILKRQHIEYCIFMVEQSNKGKFNRGMLQNVGYLEALKIYNFTCFIFHDIDLIPEDDRNIYACQSQPRHLAVAIDSHGYKLIYEDYFGGAISMKTEQFRKVNGFSNEYWGWGAEDDDMLSRVVNQGFKFVRYSPDIARYKMLSHKKEVGSPVRFQLLDAARRRFSNDGLNSIKYEVLKLKSRKLYTWVFVQLNYL